PHPGAARDAPPAALRPHTRRAGVVYRPCPTWCERARRRADLLRYLRPPPAFALRRRRDGHRLDPLLPRAHGLDVQEASLLDALGHPRAAELLLVPPGARDVHRGPRGCEAPPRGGDGERHVVERLPAQRLDVAAVTRGRRRALRGRAGGSPAADRLRQRRATLPDRVTRR